MTAIESSITIQDAIGHVTDATKELDAIAESVRDLPMEEASARLVELRAAITMLRQAESEMERWIAEVFEELKWKRPHEFAGVGLVEVNRPRGRRQWDHQGLAKAWLEAVIVSNGGVSPSPWDVKDGLLRVAGIGYWKTTELKKLGIDADDYCDSSPGAPSVKIQE